MTDSSVLTAHKTLLKGGFAAAAPGLVAVVAATTTAQSTLSTYTGMTSNGVAALGVVFFCLAFLFTRSRWWAGIPGLVCIVWILCFLSTKAFRLLMLYYQFNPIQSLYDLAAPLSVISFHLCLMVIAGFLGWIMIKALRLGRSIGPRPVSRHIWIVTGIWLVIVIWQSAPPV